MLTTLIVENERGERLDLSPFSARNDGDTDYTVTDIRGLCPVPNNIGTQEYANSDGVLINNIRCGKRNIVIDITLGKDIEKSRMNLYRYFAAKKITRLYLDIGGRSLYIDGYVETSECNFFTGSEVMQISMICPDPYFKAHKEYTLSIKDSVAMFEFPFSIPMEGIVFSEKGSMGKSANITGGNAESGIIFEITALKPYGAWNNHRTLIFENKTTEIRFSLNELYLSSGDILYINTFQGYKIARIRRNNGTVDNVLPQFSGGWINIIPGINNIEVHDRDDTDYTMIDKLEIKAQTYEYYIGV